ncbi:LuxR C-terminal-related transcriptional regulator [uncultured Salinibacterium sp.]|uniref:helix-turn-helix transcriptional regulator n=1 Tax=uncultured Salinibacterium sp. TaxID=459274 RepID=UPI0030DBE365|tara:strand:+ start:45733 stop:46758 length:1026 start_codon:yes stop_codon:yes gene_type:complete
MGLSDTDAQAVLRVAGRLTEHPPLEFADVLDAVRELIDCDSASFNDMVLATRDFRYVMSPAGEIAKATRLKPQYDKYFHEHPLITAATSTRGLGAIRFCDVDGGADFTSTDLFRHFYGPFNVRFQLVVELPSPPDVVVGYALNRREAMGEFSDRDVAVMNALSGHLAMHHRFALDVERSRLVDAEMDRYAWAVVSVRSDGVVEASSSTVLDAGARVPDSLASIIADTAHAPGSDSRHEVMIGTQRWHCIVHAVRMGPTVLLLRRQQDVAADTDVLMDAGLTPRQADVLIALARTGGSNNELAQELGMSESTVKKHLEGVFRALQVTSRAAAVLRLRELTES